MGKPLLRPTTSLTSLTALPILRFRPYLTDFFGVIVVFPVAGWPPVPLSSPVGSPCTPDRGNFLSSLDSHTSSSLEARRLAHAGSRIPPSDPFSEKISGSP